MDNYREIDVWAIVPIEMLLNAFLYQYLLTLVSICI